MNKSDEERQIQLSGVQFIFLIIAMAWVAVLIPLVIAIASMPDMLDDKQAGIACLFATLAFAGAAASWFFRRAGVYVYVFASLMLLGNGVWHWLQGGGASFPFAFLLLFLVYIGAVIASWSKFKA